MIECYYGDCRFHESHYDPDSGPLCAETDCRATPQELVWFGQNRVRYLKEIHSENKDT